MLNITRRICGYKTIFTVLVATMAVAANDCAFGQAPVEVLEPGDDATIKVNMMAPSIELYVKFGPAVMPSSAVAKFNYIEDGVPGFHQSNQIPVGVPDHPDYGACWKMTIPIQYKHYSEAFIEVVALDTVTMMIVEGESTNITVEPE